jgi:sirohydrochlorin cobaltochelatase
LVKKIFDVTARQQELHPDVSMTCLPEMGVDGKLLELMREREIETQLGEVKMNCETCKFRLVASESSNGDRHHDHHHGHGHDHDHGHGHGHDHSHGAEDPYADLDAYHERIWRTP